jgi:hypothetical protein
MSDQCVQPCIQYAGNLGVQEPGCISLFDLKERMHETRFPEGMVKAILTELLQAMPAVRASDCERIVNSSNILSSWMIT